MAEQTVKARQLVADQVTELARSKLKSGLDVSFANVNLAEAKLLLAAAQNSMEAAFASLSAALGYQEQQSFQLTEESLPPVPGDELPALVNAAILNRPELGSLRRELSASQSFAKAEHGLNLPTIGVVGSAGVMPTHVDALRGHYGAIGFNVNIPIFNGHLFSARQAEADLKAQAASQEVRDLENRVVQEVRIAWLDAKTSYQRLDLTGDSTKLPRHWTWLNPATTWDSALLWNSARPSSTRPLPRLRMSVPVMTARFRPPFSIFRRVGCDDVGGLEVGKQSQAHRGYGRNDQEIRDSNRRSGLCCGLYETE